MRYIDSKDFDEKSQNTLDKNGGFVNSVNINNPNALGRITPPHFVCAKFAILWIPARAVAWPE